MLNFNVKSKFSNVDFQLILTGTWLETDIVCHFIILNKMFFFISTCIDDEKFA